MPPQNKMIWKAAEKKNKTNNCFPLKMIVPKFYKNPRRN